MVPESKFNSVKVLGKIFLLNTLIFISVNGFAQFVSYGNDFLKIGSTAQGIALGNSILSLSTGASALYYNPANIINLNKPIDIAITHSEYFADVANYDFASLAYKYNNKIALSFGLIRLGVDNIPNTILIYNNGTFNLDKITYFSVEDYAFLFAIAKKQDQLSYALRSKIIYRHLGNFVNGYGFGLDAAITYHWRKYIVSINMQDIVGTFTAWFYNLDQQTINILDSTDNQIPHNSIEITIPSSTIGISRKFIINEKWKANAETDLNIEWAQKNNMLINTQLFSLSPQLGLELQFKDVLYIRGGISNFQKVKYFYNQDSLGVKNKINIFPSIGLGFRYHGLYIDYAFENFINQAVALQSHFITVHFGINRKKERMQ